MATIKTGTATITMASGKVIPVPPGFDSMTINGPTGDLITWPDGEWWITSYGRLLIDGLAGDLADGETFTSHDGTTWTRHGAEMLVTSPAQSVKAAA